MNGYIQAVEFFVENNIQLSKDELLDLKNKVYYNEMNRVSLDKIFDTLLESYISDNSDNKINSLQEASSNYKANFQIRNIFKTLKKEYKELTKDYERYVKEYRFKDAKNTLKKMIYIINKSEDEVRKIDATGLWNKASGYIMAYTVNIARTLIVMLSADVAGSTLSNMINNKGKKSSNSAKPNYQVLSITDKSYKAPSTNSKNTIIKTDTGSLVSMAVDISADLINNIDLLIQKKQDKELAKKNNDLKEYFNAQNDYRERVILVFKGMKKEIAKKSAQIDKLISAAKKQ